MTNNTFPLPMGVMEAEAKGEYRVHVYPSVGSTSLVRIFGCASLYTAKADVDEFRGQGLEAIIDGYVY